MKRYVFFQFLCLPVMLLVFFLAGSAFGQTKPNPIALEQYGSLGGAVDEATFRPALEAWVRHGNQFMQKFAALTPEKADRLLISEPPQKVLQDSQPLSRLEDVVRPVLERWVEEKCEEEQLNADDRKVLALLRQSGLTFEMVDGWAFLLVDESFFENLLGPCLGPAAPAYIAVKKSQPQYFFYNDGCTYPHESMASFAVAWEQFLSETPSGVYAEDAAKRWRSILDYLLFSELPATAAFSNDGKGKMHDDWREELQGIAAAHPKTRMAGILAEYLAAIKADGYTLSPTNKKAFSAKIAAAFRSAPTPKVALSGPEQKLLGRHMFSLQWISTEKFGTATFSHQDAGLYIDARQELNGDYVTLKGEVAVVNDKEFTVTGELVTRLSDSIGGKECVRNETFTFKATGNRKYWRLQEMNNPCEGGGVVDYVDVYF